MALDLWYKQLILHNIQLGMLAMACWSFQETQSGETEVINNNNINNLFHFLEMVYKGDPKKTKPTNLWIKHLI